MSDKILIKNGNIMDGTGSPPFKTEVLINGEYIEDIGSFEGVDAAKIIDAKGLVIAPGFIDGHTHLDFFLPSRRHAEVLESWIRMGVTTLVAGNCGFSPAPINHDREKDLSIYWNFALPQDGLKYEWTNFKEYLDFLERIGQNFNVAILVGHNTIRNNIMGFEARFANDTEISEMKNQIRQALDEGAFGLSLGLGYVPGIYSHTDEILELSSILKEYDRPLVPHTRGLSNQYHKAVEEVINIAEKNEIKLHLSHHSSVNPSTVKKADKIIMQAKKRGAHIVGHDNIPYAAACSTSFCGLPPKLLDGGIDKCLERLKDQKIREKIIQDIKNVKITWPNWENDYWTDVFLKETLLSKLLRVKLLMHGFKLEKNQKFENMPLKKIAKKLNKDYFNTFFDLIIEEHKGIFFSAVIAGGKIGDMVMAKAISDPYCSIITDHVGADYKTPHPVQYGAFTKVLGKFARDKGYFTMEEAIRKMTSLPASQMQLENRGFLKKGNFADITIFNPKTVNSPATFKDPHQFSEGIEYVIINGKIVLEKGTYYPKTLAGKVLRKLCIKNNVLS